MAETKEVAVSVITVGGASYFGRLQGKEIVDAVKLTANNGKVGASVFKSWLKLNNLGETLRIVTGGADSITVQDLTRAQQSEFVFLQEQFKQAQALALPMAENNAFDELCPDDKKKNGRDSE